MSGGISRRHVRIGSPNVRGGRAGGVRGDREPEGAGADDCGVDAIHALNLERNASRSASFAWCAPATTASSSANSRPAPATRSPTSQASRRTRKRSPGPHGSDRGLAARGRPVGQPYFSGAAALNGAGELTGAWEIEEWGARTTPCSSPARPTSVPCYNGATHVLTARQPTMARDDVMIPVVGECDPSSWCDMRDGPEPGDELVARALDDARRGCDRRGPGRRRRRHGDVRLRGGHRHVLARRRRAHASACSCSPTSGSRNASCCAAGRSGVELASETASSGEGSCICLVATDAPLLPHQLRRLARRPFIGLARTGSYGSHGSGEIALAWTTANLLTREAPAETALRMLATSS